MSRRVFDVLAGAIMLGLAVLGLRHAQRTPAEEELLAPKPRETLVGAPS